MLQPVVTCLAHFIHLLTAQLLQHSTWITITLLPFISSPLTSLKWPGWYDYLNIIDNFVCTYLNSVRIQLPGHGFGHFAPALILARVTTIWRLGPLGFMEPGEGEALEMWNETTQEILISISAEGIFFEDMF